MTDGLLWVVDKPSGITSHDVIKQVRRQTGVKRVGHAGTLDPLATGLLIVLVGRTATRLQAQVMGMSKEYLCTAELGYVTDTNDLDGQVTQRWPWTRVSQVTHSQLVAASQQFRGGYQQQVPAYSAVKLGGRKLYQLARAQQVVVRPVRQVQIESLEVKDFDPDPLAQRASFTFRVRCGSGTYVRALVDDLGRAVGVGATVVALRRTQLGPFRLPDQRQLAAPELRVSDPQLVG